MHYSFDENTEDLIETRREEYVYNLNGDLESFVSYMWYTMSIEWEGVQKIEYEYNEDQEVLNKYYSSWNSGASVWKYSYMDEYEYDENGNMIIEIRSNWSEIDSDWNSHKKYEYTYTIENNLVLTFKISYWNSGLSDFEYFTMSENEYDADYNLSVRFYREWSSILSDWVDFTKREYEYDANNNMLSDISYGWNSTLEIWVGGSMQEYEYDENFNITLIHDFNYDVVNEVWVNNNKTVAEYDDVNNMIVFSYYYWNSTPEVWYESTRYIREYNTTIEPENIAKPFWLESNSKFDYMLMNNENYSNNSIEMYLDNVDYYYYSDFESSTEDISLDQQLQLYPNPCKDILTIHVNNFVSANIYDLNGKLVLQSNNCNFDTSMLPKGVYIIKIETQKANKIDKFVKI